MFAIGLLALALCTLCLVLVFSIFTLEMLGVILVAGMLAALLTSAVFSTLVPSD